MWVIDAIFRFSGLGMLLLMMVLLLRKPHKSIEYQCLFFACLSVFCLLLGFAPSYFTLPEPIKFTVRLLDIPHLVFIWLFALSLFSSDFTFKTWHVAILLIYCLPILVVRLGQFGVLPAAHYAWYLLSSLFSIGLMLHLVISTLLGKKDDLMEKRRTARDYFVLVISFITLGVALSEILLVADNIEYLYTAKVAIIWVGIVWSALWLLELSDNPFSPDVETQEQKMALTSREQMLIDKLDQQLEQQKVYLDPNLTPALLAQKIGLPVYKLRQLINQKLGYQNFSSYLNHYRIEAVKQDLRDPQKRDLPILSIALEHGFNSLSPFNKAFKSQEGMTPSDYRKQVESR